MVVVVGGGGGTQYGSKCVSMAVGEQSHNHSNSFKTVCSNLTVLPVDFGARHVKTALLHVWSIKINTAECI